MRSRSLSLAGIVLLVCSLLAPMAFVPQSATALQADATPPPIEPADDLPIEEEGEEGGGEEPALELGGDLGNGGQPEDLPREIAIGSERFLFDRIVLLDRGSLTEIAREGPVIALASAAEGPFDAVYLSAPPRNEDELGRYLPERLDTPDVTCPADNAEFSGLDVAGTVYIFAGVEPDLDPANLEQVASSEGQPIYADPGASQPFPELFFETGGGLQRFVLTEDGRPASLADSLALGGVVFDFVADVTDTLDPGSLTRIGCAGPYPVFTSSAATEGDRFVGVGERLFQFSGDVAATEAPVVEPTAEPTEAPTEVPTEIPTEEPTEVPTEEPTELPTEEPTEVPTEAPTEVPTEEPTAEPTEVPTEVPTEAATEAPGTEPTEEPSAVPTEEPTEAPAPTASPTPAPTQQPQAPAVVPTLAPNVPPPPAVTAEPTIVCSGALGPINDQGIPSYLPSRIQYGGIAYAFVSTQPPAEAGELTAIGCAGAFEVAISDQADQGEVLYLRYTGTGPAGEVVYRYEAGVTYDVEFEVTGRAQRIGTEDQVFQLVDVWLPSIYSSTTVILFVADPEASAPDTIYAVNVSSSASGDAVGEYQRVEGNETAADEVVAAAEGTGLHPDLTINGTRYVLANVYLPIGTTTNGFVTIFSASGEGEAELLLGRDLRRLELFLYTPVPSASGG